MIPLGGEATGGASFAYPLDLMAVELFVSLPEPYQTPDATIAVRDLAASGDDGDVADPPRSSWPAAGAARRRSTGGRTSRSRRTSRATS